MSRQPRVPFSEPAIGAEEIRAVTKVLKSRWLTMGEVTAEFERRFAAKLGVKHAVAVTNGTAALHLANLALGVGPDDEVICPALTFVASANASRYCGAKVRFADVVSETDLTIDPDSVRSLITPRTKAVTVVHYAGFACRMEPLLALAREHGLRIIEDCAHAPGAFCRVEGVRKPLGTVGDIACFSFFGNKNITTAEGGMVVTDDDTLAERVRLLRSHAMTALSLDRKTGHAGQYDVTDLGYNYRIDELRSAVGLAQLDKLDRLNEARRRAWRLYAEFLSDRDHLVVPFTDRPLEDSACHLMPVLFRKNPTEIRRRLAEHGVQTSRHYIPVPNFTLYGRQAFSGKVPILDNLVTLPLHPGLKPKDIAFVASLI